jgi:hypothetical protein
MCSPVFSSGTTFPSSFLASGRQQLTPRRPITCITRAMTGWSASPHEFVQRAVDRIGMSGARD